MVERSDTRGIFARVIPGYRCATPGYGVGAGYGWLSLAAVLAGGSGEELFEGALEVRLVGEAGFLGDFGQGLSLIHI